MEFFTDPEWNHFDLTVDNHDLLEPHLLVLKQEPNAELDSEINNFSHPATTYGYGGSDYPYYYNNYYGN